MEKERGEEGEKERKGDRTGGKCIPV